ncbi:MAG TPA: FISUMP domain-containing protein [Bacteroidales bacterium]|nr:FISUMP domain-containing protein [Bacteroidales bacterium]HPR13383.1 FISUMP domain-containing protein [Bacteroidales bacterium]HRW83911.1 FISUMP domain-containing protein [Bacteroidales bacterium]
MRRLHIFLILIASCRIISAQDYYVTFSGSGSSNTVTTVLVENLSRGTSITMNGSDVLHLVGTSTGVEPLLNKKSSKIRIYPNPVTDFATMQFDLPEAGNTSITVYSISGRNIAQIRAYLGKGQHAYRLEGFNKGYYLVRILSDRYSISGIFVCTSLQNSTRRITYKDLNLFSAEENNNDYQSYMPPTGSKGVSSERLMDYNDGDRLKFTGTTDIYSTIVTDIPDQNKTINFNFISCTDGDNQHYPVVTIGSQTWMAENLRSTKFSDGTPIPYVTDNTEWSNLSSPGYCWYNNDESTYRNSFGALYNWYVIDTSSNNVKNVCPTGWHVPTLSEWTTLSEFLGGESVAGGKLKETGTSYWWSPNTGATNESGFTARPGGCRDISGVSYDNGSVGLWRTSTRYGTTVRPWSIGLISNYADFTSITGYTERDGQSIRCISGDPRVVTTTVSLIGSNIATAGGSISSACGIVTERGIYWGTSENPETNGFKIPEGSGTGLFSTNLTGLQPGTTYYLCAYATNSSGTTYGNEITFTTVEDADFRIENLEPPEHYYPIPEGSCGESVLWTICQRFGLDLSQEEINQIGGDPGRGLHGGEMINVLDSLKIPYRPIRFAYTWENTVDTLKNTMLRRNPVILGVKIYPDSHPEWYADHFILFAGTNTNTRVFYYNDFISKRSISYEKLCNTTDGYSLINSYYALFALEIILPDK